MFNVFISADGDILVNIFSPIQRNNFNLERLWRNGEVLDISDCLREPEEQELHEDELESIDNWVD